MTTQQLTIEIPPVTRTPPKVATCILTPTKHYLKHSKEIRVLQDGSSGNTNHVTLVSYMTKRYVQKRAVRHKVLSSVLEHEHKMRSFIGEAGKDTIPWMTLLHTNDYSYGITKYLGKNELYTLLEKGGLPIPISVQIMKNLVSAVMKLHAVGIAHGDITPENIIIVPPMQPMLIDLGLSAPVATTDSPMRGKLKYADPLGLVNGTIPNMAASDVWNLGVTFVTMLMGLNPWEIALPTDVSFAYVQEHGLKHLLTQWGFTTIPDELISVVEGMLTVDLANRLTLSKVAEMLESC
jgi:serine/threonine protein kinase